MKFITNKISMQPKRFSDFVEEVLGQQEQKVKTASVEEEIKTAEKDEAESSGQPEAEGKLVNDPDNDKEGGKTGKADNKEAPSSGQPEAEGKLVNQPKKVESETEEVKKSKTKKEETKKKEKEKEKKTEAVNNLTWIKVSKLNAPTREMLRKYWLTMYPLDYVDAMLAEK